jgi:leucyl aminopeptidase (aminopeptidase T)
VVAVLAACAASLWLSACGESAPAPAATTPAAAPAAAMSAVDTKAFAAKLVHQVANIKEGEIVMINGGAKDQALLEEISLEVRKAGAWPLVSASTEQLGRRSFDEVPAKYDSQAPTLGLKLTQMADVTINVDFIESNSLMADVPPARVVARAAAGQPVADLAIKRGVRQVNVGNGLLPTADNARDFGVPQDQLAKIYWAGVNTDYDKLQATAAAVSKALSGKKVHVTNPNGTDLTIDITGRPVFSSDGVISADDVKRGGAAVSVWLPAGEVYVTPVAGTAEGKVVAEHYFYQGQTIDRLELTFAKGKMTAMTAASGLEKLKATYDAAGPGKDEFGAVDIGINPDVQLVPGSRMVGWMPAGMVTVGVGNNQWAGGSNTGGFSAFPFLPGSTLEVDGRAIVKDGKLVVK